MRWAERGGEPRSAQDPPVPRRGGAGGPVLTLPLPLGDSRSSILRDPRARRCAETALDQPFRTIQRAMGEDSKVIARTLPRHARGLGAGLVGGECE